MLAESAIRPAHLGWRVGQALTDDLIVSAIAVILGYAFGLLSGDGRAINLRESLNSPADSIRRLLVILPKAGMVYAIYWAIKLAYQTGFLTFFAGQTPGCWLFGVRVSMKDGKPVNWRAALGRTVAGGVIGQLPIVGHVLRFLDYLVALFNRRRMAVRDMAAGTMLIHASKWWLPSEDSIHG